MGENIVHFKNASFMAVVEGRGPDPIRCMPMVVESDFSCGVAVVFEGSGALDWGLMSPRDLVTAWRATEVLRLLTEIKGSTLCAAHTAARRNPTESDVDRHVRPIVAVIGQEAHDRIMSAPVPDEIVRAILDHQGREFSPDLYPIVEEVRAGTIEWRQEFAEAGIKHPDEIDAERVEQDRTIEQYEHLLQAYAQFCQKPRQCLGMNETEDALLTLIDKGGDEGRSPEVVVAVAGIVGSMAVSFLALSFVPVGAVGSADDLFEGSKREAIRSSARWLATTTSPPWWAFWRRSEGIRVPEAEILLEELLDQYYSEQRDEAASG